MLFQIQAIGQMECVKIAYVMLAQCMNTRQIQVVVVLKLNGVDRKGYLRNIYIQKPMLPSFLSSSFVALGTNTKAETLHFGFLFWAEL